MSSPRELALEAELKRLRELLDARERESRRGEEQIRFQARLLDAVHEAVIATDLAGVVLYWNRFAEQLYGWTATEAVGQNIMKLTPAEAAVARPKQRWRGSGAGNLGRGTSR